MEVCIDGLMLTVNLVVLESWVPLTFQYCCAAANRTASDECFGEFAKLEECYGQRL